MSSLKGKAVHVDERYLHVELQDGRFISTPMIWVSTYLQERK
jgi:hypothetical protein